MLLQLGHALGKYMSQEMVYVIGYLCPNLS